MERVRQDVTIRDLLYFDFDKAASLLSQIEGGLLQSVSETSEKSGTDRNQRTYDFRVFKGEFGGVSTEKTSIIESKFLHHDLFTRIEYVLSEIGVIADINKLVEPDVVDSEVIRSAIDGFSYLKVEGWIAFEDYSRLFEISENFNDLVAFVSRAGLNETEMFKEFKKQRDEINNTDVNRDKKLRALQTKEKELDQLIKKTVEEKQLPEWLFKGVQLWISVYLKDKLSVRVYPFEKCPTFEVVANLKRESFVDDNLAHLMYSYGTYPNIKLSIFGLITSIPKKDKPQFDTASIHSETGSEEANSMEQAYRGVFGANDVMEKFTSFHKYPRVVINPIAVFRDIKGSI